MFQSGTVSRHPAPIFPLARLTHDTASRAKQTNFHGIGIEIQNLGNFLDGESFDFFQNEHHAVPFIQTLQQDFDALLGFQLVGDILRAAFEFFGGAELLDLLLAQVRLVQKRPNLFLS